MEISLYTGGDVNKAINVAIDAVDLVGLITSHQLLKSHVIFYLNLSDYKLAQAYRKFGDKNHNSN